MASTKDAKKKTTTKKTTTAKKTTSTKKVAAKKTTTKKEVKPVVKEEVVKEVKKEEKGNNNTAKTVAIIVALIIFFIAIFAISNNAGKGKYSKSSTTNNTQTSTNNVEEESNNIKEDEMGDLTEIDIDDYLELLDGEEASIIYIGRPTCSHCVIQKPIMQYMVFKYGVTVNYLNTDELDDEGYTKLQKSDDFFKEGWGTPTTLIVKDGKVADKSEGETSIEDLTTLFTKYGLISE